MPLNENESFDDYYVEYEKNANLVQAAALVQGNKMLCYTVTNCKHFVYADLVIDNLIFFLLFL